MTDVPIVFHNTDWTIAQTFAWICLRDPKQLDRAFGIQTVPILETALSPVVSLINAERQIREHLAQSRLHCSGVRNGNREAISAHPWASRTFLFQTGAVRDFDSSDRWDSVLFPRGEVIALWPSKNSEHGHSAGRHAPNDSPAPVRSGPKPGQQTQKHDWYKFAEKCLTDGTVKPGRGAPAEIARRIIRDPRWQSYAQDTVEKVTRTAVNEWRRKYPEKSGK